jgi:geranylgeranyl pyrophosphate synthase/uncharacterized protein with NAD-binding domain and iron-sulfur cluster
VAKVVILGGGVAGLSAAQELVERGFQVVVIEKTGIPGGKARSSPVMPHGPSPWQAEPRYPSGAQYADHVGWVPGEHGFRFFPGFYKHVVDTMSRIPTPDGISAADHLVSIGRCGLTQYDKPTFNFPMRFTRTPGDVATGFAALVAGFSSITGLTAHELAHFFGRIWQIMTSCDERRLAEYEKIPWWQFIDAGVHSIAYQKFLATGITRSLVAAKAQTASTRTIGNIFVQLLLDIIDPLVATSDRVLDGPTNRVWIYPWLQHLQALGATYLYETAVTEILYDRSRVTGVRVQNGSHTEVIRGDYYICALPLERVVPLLSPALVSGDPCLEGLRELNRSCLEWMNGVQFYFRTPVRLVRGHMNHIDTEWALTSISQVDVWRTGTMNRYGPRNIAGIVSVDVSDWRAPAPNGRTAMEHSREDVCREVWRQLKRSVNTPGEEPLLRDEDLIGWFIDSDIDRDPNDPGLLANTEPLLVNSADTWKLRPEAVTAIPNFFLASDYVRTHTDLATMEAANEAARRAVNGILDADGFSGGRCQVWKLHEPLALEPLRAWDAVRFGAGLPWDGGMLPVAISSLRAADPVLRPLADAMGTVAPYVVRMQEAADALEHHIDADEHMAQALEEHLGATRDASEAAVPVALIQDAAIAAGRHLRAGTPVSEPYVRTPVPAEANTGPLEFAPRLEWYRSMAFETLRNGIPDTPPQSFLYDPIREFVSRPSKGLRPALCIASCLAHGGRAEDALPSAAAIELLHNAFLVHDDIEDGSEARRGGPVLHRTIGTPLAINAGDAMNALAMRLFRSNVSRLGPGPALRVFDEVDHMLMESLEGQALELGWVRENNCGMTADDYLRLVLKKTAWYSFIHPLRIGGLVGGLDDDTLDRFNRFGFLLGAAFQIQDDVLNLIGDEGRYGKEIGGDLFEGKRTLPIAHALLNSAPGDRTILQDFLGRPREGRLPRQMFEVQRILAQGGSIEWARSAARALARAAQEELPSALADAREGPDRAFIASLVDYLVERDV